MEVLDQGGGRIQVRAGRGGGGGELATCVGASRARPPAREPGRGAAAAGPAGRGARKQRGFLGAVPPFKNRNVWDVRNTLMFTYSRDGVRYIVFREVRHYAVWRELAVRGSELVDRGVKHGEPLNTAQGL